MTFNIIDQANKTTTYFHVEFECFYLKTYFVFIMSSVVSGSLVMWTLWFLLLVFFFCRCDYNSCYDIKKIDDGDFPDCILHLQSCLCVRFIFSTVVTYCLAQFKKVTVLKMVEFALLEKIMSFAQCRLTEFLYITLQCAWCNVDFILWKGRTAYCFLIIETRRLCFFLNWI